MHGSVHKRGILIRLLVVTELALVLGATLAHGARVDTKSSADQAATIQETACHLAGGDTETTTNTGPDGKTQATEVHCTGGLLDGMNCFNTNSATACGKTRQRPTPPVNTIRVPGSGAVAAPPVLASPTPYPLLPVATPAGKPRKRG